MPLEISASLDADLDALAYALPLASSLGIGLAVSALQLVPFLIVTPLIFLGSFYSVLPPFRSERSPSSAGRLSDQRLPAGASANVTTAKL